MRGGLTSERCLEVNATDDGSEDTVTDALIGLMWQRGPEYGYSTAVGESTWIYEGGNTSNSLMDMAIIIHPLIIPVQKFSRRK